jgi:hypothetical protein
MLAPTDGLLSCVGTQGVCQQWKFVVLESLNPSRHSVQKYGKLEMVKGSYEFGAGSGFNGVGIMV